MLRGGDELRAAARNPFYAPTDFSRLCALQKAAVVIILQVEPRLHVHAKIQGQTKRVFGADAQLAVDDFAKAARRYAKPVGNFFLG